MGGKKMRRTPIQFFIFALALVWGVPVLAQWEIVKLPEPVKVGIEETRFDYALRNIREPHLQTLAHNELSGAPHFHKVERTDHEDIVLLIYTSGSAGTYAITVYFRAVIFNTRTKEFSDDFLYFKRRVTASGSEDGPRTKWSLSVRTDR